MFYAQQHVWGDGKTLFITAIVMKVSWRQTEAGRICCLILLLLSLKRIVGAGTGECGEGPMGVCIWAPFPPPWREVTEDSRRAQGSWICSVCSIDAEAAAAQLQTAFHELLSSDHQNLWTRAIIPLGMFASACRGGYLDLCPSITALEWFMVKVLSHLLWRTPFPVDLTEPHRPHHQSIVS